MTNDNREGLIEADLTGSIIAGFYKVYNTLGVGFSEHVYPAAMARELMPRGHRVRRDQTRDGSAQSAQFAQSAVRLIPLSRSQGRNRRRKKPRKPDPSAPVGCGAEPVYL
jgi:hypothetical protein